MNGDKLKIIGRCPITGLTLRTKDSWKYQSNEYFIHPYALGDGSIIIVNSKGRPSIKTIQFGIDVFKKIQNTFKNIKEFIIISNQKEVKALPPGARRLYIDFIKDNSKIIGAIFYNVNSVTRLSLRLGKALNITTVSVIASNSYNESIIIAQKLLKKDYLVKKNISIKNKYLNKLKNIKQKYVIKLKAIINRDFLQLEEELKFLNEFLLNINWKTEEEDFDIAKLKDTPFKLIYETIIYIKSDLHSLIKERDNHRKELEKLNIKLENKVEERTRELKEINKNLLKEIERRELIENSLIRAKELAEDTSKSKSLFLANISHELKTPMNSILGYSSIGIQKIDKINKDKVKNYFEKINKGGKRLLQLLDDLIDIARLENLNIEYEFTKINIVEILKPAIEEMNYKAENKNIKITLNKNNLNNYYINADKKRIRQVIDNILTNAIKFTKENKTIEIILENNLNNISLKFKDEGPGIASSEVFKIFNTFYQGVKTKNNTRGSGLGLAISKKIILAHNGKIWAHNREDGVIGSIFIIKLPLFNENYNPKKK